MSDSSRPLVRVIQPPTWAGITKRPGIMVCGACSDPDRCIELDRCRRATDADYVRKW